MSVTNTTTVLFAAIIYITICAALSPTTHHPINNSIIPVTNATGFQLCTKLNLAGCGVTSIHDFVQSYVNTELHDLDYNYTLPLDPCEFENINMTWILSVAELSLLQYITSDQVLTYMPCALYIQMPPDFLSDRYITDITTDTYWFGPNGHCPYNASNILDCSDPNRTIVNQSATFDLTCFYPFVESIYETPFKELYDAGFKHCGISCDYIPYLHDIKKLDAFNYAASMISLIFGVGFFINMSFEFYKTHKNKSSFAQVPLTFDIPIIISVWMMVLTILFAITSWVGKEYFSCEIGSYAQVIKPAQKHNMRCYIAGQFTSLSILSIYIYCAVLAFSIWSSIANPFKPLWGIKKIWYHVATNAIVLAFHISACIEDIFQANAISGVCGPNVVGKNGAKYLFSPLMFDLMIFSIFTPLTIYQLSKRINYKKGQNYSDDTDRAMVHLTIRLVIYSIFVEASSLCFLYLSGRFIVDGYKWMDDVRANVNCMIDNALFGGNTDCILELSVEDDVHWMQGCVLFFVSSASFVLSCTNQRCKDYSRHYANMKQKTTKSIQSLSVKASRDKRMMEDSQISGERKPGKRGITVDESTTQRSVISYSKRDNKGNTRNQIPLGRPLQLEAVPSIEVDSVEMTEPN